MLNLLLKAFVITLGLIGPAMAQERILYWQKSSALRMWSPSAAPRGGPSPSRQRG